MAGLCDHTPAAEEILNGRQCFAFIPGVAGDGGDKVAK